LRGVKDIPELKVGSLASATAEAPAVAPARAEKKRPSASEVLEPRGSAIRPIESLEWRDQCPNDEIHSWFHRAIDQFDPLSPQRRAMASASPVGAVPLMARSERRSLIRGLDLRLNPGRPFQRPESRSRAGLLLQPSTTTEFLQHCRAPVQASGLRQLAFSLPRSPACAAEGSSGAPDRTHRARAAEVVEVRRPIWPQRRQARTAQQAPLPFVAASTAQLLCLSKQIVQPSRPAALQLFKASPRAW